MRTIGLDIGRSGIKAVTDTMRLFGLPMVAKPPKEAQWRSLGALDRVVDQDGVRRLESLLLTYKGEEYLVGEYGERVGLPAMHVMTVEKADETTRLLVLAALAALDAPSVCQLCLGVPTHGYAQQAGVLGAFLRGEHQVRLADRERTFILKGVVVPEGLGLWARAADVEGRLDERLLSLPTVVVDFGHRTIQVVAFQGLRMMAPPYVSVHGVYEVWEDALIETFEGPGQTVFESPQRALLMTRLLREGKLSIRGVGVSLEQLRPRLLAHAAKRWERVRTEIVRSLAGVQYERVVAGGGGVSLFAGLLEEVFGGRLVVLDDRFAQAEGYRLLSEHRVAVERA